MLGLDHYYTLMLGLDHYFKEQSTLILQTQFKTLTLATKTYETRG